MFQIMQLRHRRRYHNISFLQLSSVRYPVMKIMWVSCRKMREQWTTQHRHSPLYFDCGQEQPGMTALEDDVANKISRNETMRTISYCRKKLRQSGQASHNLLGFATTVIWTPVAGHSEKRIVTSWLQRLACSESEHSMWCAKMPRRLKESKLIKCSCKRRWKQQR